MASRLNNYTKSSSPSYSSTSRSCLCSPTSHPGSFRCSIHRRRPDPTHYWNRNPGRDGAEVGPSPSPSNSAKMMMRTLLKNFVMKPSSHDRQRSMDFKPKPTRFYKTNCAGNSGCNNNSNQSHQLIVS